MKTFDDIFFLFLEQNLLSLTEYSKGIIYYTNIFPNEIMFSSKAIIPINFYYDIQTNKITSMRYQSNPYIITRDFFKFQKNIFKPLDKLLNPILTASDKLEHLQFNGKLFK